MGENPPVTNVVMASQNACSIARTGSMPENRHMSPSITVAMAMMTAVMRAMSCVVCTTLGTTCSLRPSALPMRLPNTPMESATTMRPNPPSKCIMKRNMLSA